MKVSYPLSLRSTLDNCVIRGDGTLGKGGLIPLDIDNAIPIEGWISDPTDNDLLHLVPLLEGLQYVTDVRALLALRQGQAQQA